MQIRSLPSERQISSPLQSGFVSPSRDFAEETRLAAATAGFAGSGRADLTRRGLEIGDLGGRGFGVKFGGRSGGERSVEPRVGQTIRVRHGASAWLRRAGWVGDGGVNAEKCRWNLVRGRAVAYADGWEDDTAKSYDVGEGVVGCPDSYIVRSSAAEGAPRSASRMR
ncbi:hypothetical protein K438DRAFT_1762470 [Mycena galopus ATCC 62051]|nr:hypothetical protein K438DRAFT_1762470 [Mycena galopus ATCC 62051]